MCNIYITQFYGRTGNNLLQLLNNIMYGKNNNIRTINIKNHNFFYLKNNLLNVDACVCDKKINRNGHQNFLYNPTLSLKTLKQLYNSFVDFKDSKLLLEIPNYDIGIHIRSGDIFNHINKSHCLYLQPPFYYYKKIIDENSTKKIILVYEDNKNPVVNKLKEYCNNKENIKFQSSTLLNDIITLSNVKTLVFSNGTFNLIPYILSNTIKNIIVPEYIKNNKWFNFDEIECTFINLPNYIQFNTWKNSIEQQKIMVEYTN